MIFAADQAVRLALERGLLRPEQLAPPGDEVGTIAELIGRGVVDAVAWGRCLAQENGLEFVDLSRRLPEASALRRLPRETAVRYEVCPLAEGPAGLHLAIADPLDLATLDSLAHVAGGAVSVAVATAADIRRAIARHYAWDESADEAARPDDPVAAAAVVAEDPAATDEAPVIRLVEAIIREAVRRRASDIHLEPLGRRFRVRYRVDGVLQEAEPAPHRLQAALVSRVKLLANISIAEKRVPQDGRMQLRLDGRVLDLRVASMPTVHGESVVLRLLDRATLAPGLAELGLAPDDRAVLDAAITSADGLVLVTGPTGSGKTTTLYSALQQLNDASRKIITVEDPIEYEVRGINQVPVNLAAGLTFAAALRAMLRQAPNVVMVGEIRDAETAEIALNASLTGHLVFSTLHTNDAVGAVTRLLDIGAKPFLIAAALRLVVAQRLVRRVCRECSAPYRPPSAQSEMLQREGISVSAEVFRRGLGCPACHGTGYRGRTGLFELLPVTDELRTMIYQRVTAARLREVAQRAGGRTMRRDGVRKVLAGLTTIEEVAAITAEAVERPLTELYPL